MLVSASGIATNLARGRLQIALTILEMTGESGNSAMRPPKLVSRVHSSNAPRSKQFCNPYLNRSVGGAGLIQSNLLVRFSMPRLLSCKMCGVRSVRFSSGGVLLLRDWKVEKGYRRMLLPGEVLPHRPLLWFAEA